MLHLKGAVQPKMFNLFKLTCCPGSQLVAHCVGFNNLEKHLLIKGLPRMDCKLLLDVYDN